MTPAFPASSPLPRPRPPRPPPAARHPRARPRRADRRLLQEAGFAGGEELYTDFAGWLAADRGVARSGRSRRTAFLSEVLSQFFTELGWGPLTARPLGDAVLALDATEWAEARTRPGRRVPVLPPDLRHAGGVLRPAVRSGRRRDGGGVPLPGRRPLPVPRGRTRDAGCALRSHGAGDGVWRGAGAGLKKRDR